jgi:hypothetical protein
MPIVVHELFIARIEDAVHGQLKSICERKGSAAHFAQKVHPTRSTEIYFPMDDNHEVVATPLFLSTFTPAHFPASNPAPNITLWQGIFEIGGIHACTAPAPLSISLYLRLTDNHSAPFNCYFDFL